MYAHRIGVVGAGYVGLTTAACLAGRGHEVVCVDVAESRIAMLRRGLVPAFEPGLGDLVAAGRRNGRLRFATAARDAAADADMVFLCLPTPGRGARRGRSEPGSGSPGTSATPCPPGASW